MDVRYERLKAAILQQAIYDYKKALRKKNGGLIFSLEHWFLSEWGQSLSGYNGEYIIEMCRKCVNMKRKKRNFKKG